MATEYPPRQNESAPRSWLARLRNRIILDDEIEDEEPITPVIDTRDARTGNNPFFQFGRSTTLRLERVEPTHIMVRRTIRSFDDAQAAVEGLKSGHPQILNLDNTPTDLILRIIDFVSGATYALDGAVEKLSEYAFLFTPTAFQIDYDANL